MPECTLVVCSAEATESVETFDKRWPEDAQNFPYCSEHIDDRAAALRDKGYVVRISKVDSNA